MNSFLKRFLPLALAPALALGLAACDSSDNDDDDDDGGMTTVDPLNAVYDTSGTEIRVVDQNSAGVAPNTGGNVTWSSDFTYILTNRVFVNDGQTLTIEPGTVIKGEPGLRENATALIVARGGRLIADGTAAEPIVFTALADDINDDTDEPDAGSWGGLIVLGASQTNTTPGAIGIEGIPATEPRGLYGCGDSVACNDDDDSGVIRYVSIRYGGSEIGAGNEINGLTLGGVGRGTTIEYVEVFRNQDDGIEWFGGTVNARYLVAAFVGDEMFDTDQGFRGTTQFAFGIHDDTGDNGFEMDGGDEGNGDELAQPYSTPTFANVTVIGAGANRGARIRENSGPSFYRTHFANFDRGVTIEDNPDGEDSRNRYDGGDAAFGQNLLFGAFTTDVTNEDYTLALLTAANATFLGDNTGVVSVSTSADGGLNPTAAGPALTNVGALPAGNAFLMEQGANCTGAVCPGNNWLRGWTALDRLGYLSGDA